MNSDNDSKLRHRAKGHMWADKRVLRFFRKTLFPDNKQYFKMVQSVYLALCQIDSDFCENREIKGLKRTCAIYSGFSPNYASSIMKFLQDCGLIEYHQINKEGTFSEKSVLNLLMFENEEYHIKSILKNYDKVITVARQKRQRSCGVYKNIIFHIITKDNNKLLRNSLLSSNKLLRNLLNEPSLRDPLRGSLRKGSTYHNKIKKLKRIKGMRTLSDEIESEQKKNINIMRKKERLKRNKNKNINVIMPKSIEGIIEHWNSLPLRKLKLNTKLHQKTVDNLKKVLRGNFYEKEMFEDRILSRKYVGNKIDYKDIIKSIDNFTKVTDNPAYATSVKQIAWYKKQTLNDFILRKNFKNGKIDNLLIKCLEEIPKPNNVTKLPIPDKYPEMSLRLKNLYVKDVLGNIKSDLSEQDMNCFKRGAERIHSFWIKNSNKMKYLHGERELPDLLYNSLKNSYNSNTSKIFPGMFCSNYTFNHIFPSYLYNESVIDSDNVRLQYDDDAKIQLYDDE